MSFLSSSSRGAQWARLILGGTAAWLVLGVFLPWVYNAVPILRHSCEQQEKYDISAGAIYYTDVPISLESEMASRRAVQEALALRAKSM
ncbi:MAG: hypothetical protein J6I40_01300 [Mailhella sp.]|nr:hypothetical protein [Mailhella sp.]